MAKNVERAREDAKTSNEFARVGAQASLLINGGAATAVLAFLSHTGEIPAAKSFVAAAPLALIIYSLGVFLTAASLLVSSKAVEHWMLYWDGDGDGTWGNRLWNVSLVLIGTALFCFLGGSVFLALSLTS
jgi:hypothetical protein